MNKETIDCAMRACLIKQVVTTANMERTPEYIAWQNMRQRCLNPKFRQHKDYGGRGITIFKEWLGRGGFNRFLLEVGKKPSSEYTLDRKENSLGYIPGNVRWATRITQNNNTTKNVHIFANGVSKTVAEWSKETGLKDSTIRCRIRMGWSGDAAINTPVRKKLPPTPKW